MKFELGQIVVTPQASESLREWGRSLEDLLSRHQDGDWGDVPSEIGLVNDQAIVERRNIASVYRTPAGKAITIFTRADRSITMVHLAPGKGASGKGAPGNSVTN
jgi:hypothetical protein